MNSQIIFALTLALVVMTSSALPAGQEVKYGGDEVYGWRYYTTAGAIYNFQNEKAIEDFRLRSLYKLTVEGPTQNHFSIEMESTSATRYLGIGTNLNLMLTTFANRQVFQIVPKVGSDTLFYLYANVTEPLVTPTADHPFEFFLKSRFSNENRTEFGLSILTVEECYGGNLSQIIPTVDRISAGNLGDKATAYKKLLSMMGSFGHMTEPQLFTVAEYIKKDVGEGDTYFQLPRLVQLLVSGDGLKFYYHRELDSYRMKYHTASATHTNILKYDFTYQNTTRKWAITYADQHQLGIDSSRRLYEYMSNTKAFTFQFRLTQTYDYFTILGTNELKTSQTASPFSFVDTAPVSPYVLAEYSVEEFTLEN